jgi:hypothetical protein
MYPGGGSSCSDLQRADWRSAHRTVRREQYEEVCEELAFHGIEYILSVSVVDGQVLHVDVEKVKAQCTSRNARLSAQLSALHDAGAPATPVRAFTSWRDVQKEHAQDTQKEDVHASMRIHLCDFRDGGGRGMARGGEVNSTC